MELTQWKKGPAQEPAELTEECPRQAQVTLRLKDAHKANTFLGAKKFKVCLSEGAEFDDEDEGLEVETDDNGYVTFKFTGEGDLPNESLRVESVTNSRFGVAALTPRVPAVNRNEGQYRAYAITLPIAGTFKVTVDSKAWRPWTSADDTTPKYIDIFGVAGKLTWTEPPNTAKTQNFTLGNQAYQSYEKNDLPCGTAITVSQPMAGAIGGMVWVKIGEGEFVEATNDDQTVDGVTFKRAADGSSFKAVVSVEKHGTAVSVHLGHKFRKVFIVGEGTWFDYAVGLAERYQKVTGDGLAWIYASQFDVTPVGNLPTANHDGFLPVAGTAKKWNQRARVQTALTRNFFIVAGPAQDDDGNAGRFNVMVEGHWDAVLADHGEFDAVIFNNPHPGYGVHECVLYGLKDSGNFSTMKGRYVSVHTLGYNVPKANVISDDLWTQKLQTITSGRFDVQRAYVRTGAGINYANRPSQTIDFWDADGAGFTWQIHQAFKYIANDDAIPSNPALTAANYGGANEFANATTNHYYCTKVTLGLHSTVIRFYRRYAPKILKSGGKVFIHGSAAYRAELEAAVKANDASTLAAAMTCRLTWNENGKDQFFVYYPTNFTSKRFHPSQFPNGYKQLKEPTLDTLYRYEYTKP